MVVRTTTRSAPVEPPLVGRAPPVERVNPPPAGGARPPGPAVEPPRAEPTGETHATRNFPRPDPCALGFPARPSAGQVDGAVRALGTNKPAFSACAGRRDRARVAIHRPGGKFEGAWVAFREIPGGLGRDRGLCCVGSGSARSRSVRTFFHTRRCSQPKGWRRPQGVSMRALQARATAPSHPNPGLATLRLTTGGGTRTASPSTPRSTRNGRGDRSGCAPVANGSYPAIGPVGARTRARAPAAVIMEVVRELPQGMGL